MLFETATAVLDKTVWHYYEADYYCFTNYSNDILHYYDLCCLTKEGQSLRRIFVKWDVQRLSSSAGVPEQNLPRKMARLSVTLCADAHIAVVSSLSWSTTLLKQ